MRKNRVVIKRKNLFLVLFKNITFFSLVILLGALCVWVKTQITRTGFRIEQKVARFVRLEKDNNKIEAKISTLTSAENIKKKIREYGIEMDMPLHERIVYLSVTKVVKKDIG